MLKTILVALDESPWSDSATTLALEWGKRFRASLLGFGILDKRAITGAEPAPLGVSSFKRERDAALLRDADKRVKHVLSRFQERCAAAGVPTDITEAIGDPSECILQQAHVCDIVLLGRETHFRFEIQDAPDSTLASVLRLSPRPVVSVPRELISGSGIMVAYGGGREVARTLQAFVQLGLGGNETIHLVGVRREDRKAEVLVPLASRYLESQEVPHKIHLVDSGLDPAATLLEQVRKIQPRLVVLGAHGYHPLRDLFLTSVTRAVLHGCPVPVLVGA